MDFIKYVIIGALLIFAPISYTLSAGYVSDHLAKAQFTSRIKSREPVDWLNALTTEYRKMYFFTDVRDCKGCDIVHEWWYKGNKVSELEATVQSDRYRWWSSKTLNDNMLGEWTVKVFIDGDFEHSKKFKYFKQSKVQKKQAPVKERVKVQDTEECEIQLRYFSDKARAEPDDPYFQFMLKKWGSRCSN